jgi:hypothetical protein
MAYRTCCALSVPLSSWAHFYGPSPPIVLTLLLAYRPLARSPTSEAETARFNLINPQTNNRIKMKTVDAGTGEEVSRSGPV